MKVVDPGHRYRLHVLDTDGPNGFPLIFVKREGPGYPGNVGHYPGTTIQEVLRACCDRLEYVNNQIPSPYTRSARRELKNAIFQLECRAAERHGRPRTFDNVDILDHAVCLLCGHVDCDGRCRT